MKHPLSNGVFLTSPLTLLSQKLNVTYPSLRIPFFRKLRCSKHAASLHTEFSKLNIQIRQVCEETNWNTCFLVHSASQSMPTTYTKKARKGDMSEFAWTSEPQIPENKTSYYSNSDCDVIKYDKWSVVGGKSDSSIWGPFPNFKISVSPI